MGHNGGQLPAPDAILAIEYLREIAAVRTRFEKTFGFALDNLSHWNPKPGLGNQLESFVQQMGGVSDLSTYVYPYDLSSHDQALQKIEGLKDRACVFTPSGTTSIVNAIAYCANSSISNIAIVRPSYFAVEELCRSFDISTHFFDLKRNGRTYSLPKTDDLIASGSQAVWITSPVYCAGVFFEELEITSWINELSEHGVTIFIDESFAPPDRSIVRMLDDSSRVIAIYVPHKSLSLNGFRVSLLTFPKHLEDPFNQWSDAFAGGLPISALEALQHFLSPAFKSAEERFKNLVDRIEEQFLKLIEKFPSTELDHRAFGHLRQVYFTDLDAALQSDMAFLEEVFFDCACGFIPAHRFGFPLETGFSFRVNLLRLDEGGFGGLYRILDKLGK